MELVWPAMGSTAAPPRHLRTLSHCGRWACYHWVWATAEAQVLVPAWGCPCRNGGAMVNDVRKGRLSCNQPTTIELGLSGQVAPVWSSPRQCGHRGMDLALPVNAPLCRLALGTDQFRSFRASISQLN